MMPASNKELSHFDTETIEQRRIKLLTHLYDKEHPLKIFHHLKQSDTFAFTINDDSASAIRAGLSNPIRQTNESIALATVKIAGQIPDTHHFVFQIIAFNFENLGTADSVLSLSRERFNAGEIEVHTHLYSSPDYLGQTDIGDLIALLEGPAWVHPQPAYVTTAQRIFGVLSIYANHIAELQFYLHDLRESLTANNQYGLKTLGMPIRLPNAY